MPDHRDSRNRPFQFESLEQRQCMAASAIGIDVNPGTASSTPNVVELNGQYYLSADNGQVGRELFRLNPDDTLSLVADIAPGIASSDVNDLSSVGGLLYFTVSAPTWYSPSMRAIYRSDGTAAGTFALIDRIRSVTTPFVPMGNQLYFSAYGSAVGDELYKTDGTVAGTALVRNIDPRYFESPYVPFDPFSSSPRNLTVLNGKLYFAASFAERELWVSDGTADGTLKAVDPSGRRASSDIAALSLFNGRLIFAARVGPGMRLFSSLGTGGTKLIASGFQSISEAQEANGALYFVAQTKASGKELWKLPANGSPVMVKDINPTGSSNPTQLINANGKLYFTADDGVRGVELWQTDGTAAGTRQVQDVNLGSPSSSPTILGNFSGSLYFAADDGVNGRELWQTNGTLSGARLVQDINPGRRGSDPTQMVGSSGIVYFTASKNTIGREVWKLAPAPPVMTLPATAPQPFTGNGPVRLAPQAVLEDVDTTSFLGAKLVMTLGTTYQTGDKLVLVPTPNVSFDGSRVLVRGVIVGVFSTGGNPRELRVFFTQDATISRVREVLRAVAFTNITSSPLAGIRKILFTLNDGEGGVASPGIVKINVQADA